MKSTLINNRWTLKLLPFRADKPEWPFWEKERLAAMYDAVRPGDTILDVGAEQGDVSALLGKWAGPGGRMILIEPSAGFWPNIRATFEANGQSPFACYQVLAGNETDKGWKERSANGLWPAAAEGKPSDDVGFTHLNERNRVDAVRIDDMSLPHVDIITMDIEGSEYEAIEGARMLIERDQPIIFVSVHPEFMWREHHHSPDDFHVMMTNYGYEPTYLAFDHEQHYMYKPIPKEEKND